MRFASPASSVIACRTAAAISVIVSCEKARSAASGVVCLVGVSSGGHTIRLDLGGLNRQMVLENDAIFGSLNANRAHYVAAADALMAADRGWLARVITRRLPLDGWREAFNRTHEDVKVVILFDEAR